MYITRHKLQLISKKHGKYINDAFPSEDCEDLAKLIPPLVTVTTVFT